MSLNICAMCSQRPQNGPCGFGGTAAKPHVFPCGWGPYGGFGEVSVSGSASPPQVPKGVSWADRVGIKGNSAVTGGSCRTSNTWVPTEMLVRLSCWTAGRQDDTQVLHVWPEAQHGATSCQSPFFSGEAWIWQDGWHMVLILHWNALISCPSVSPWWREMALISF